MAQDIAELGIRVDSRQVRQGSEALDDFARRGARAEVSANSLMGVVKSLGAGLAGLALIAKAIDFGSAVIGAQRDFDKLNSSLITATGSAANAQQAFAALQRFAANTPYGLQETTKAFIQLRNLGLTPSERALNSYGNTAAAMSKSLDQMVEAVADAATGEFERLKEFGIKAKQEGDKVSLTFQGTTTTIANSAAAIEGYLISLGETKFAGGMELQAKTLDGALAGLADTWDMTLLAFAQSGFGDAAYSAVLGLSGALQDLQAILIAVFGAADAEKKKIEELGPVHKGLTTIFETIAVLGANVAYVFTTIGKDIGAFAAAVMAAASGDFKLMLQIATQRKQDSERERKEIDARTAAILGAAETARTTREQEQKEKAAAGRDDLARYAIERKEQASLTDAQKKAAKERAAAAQAAASWYKQTTQAMEESLAMARAEIDAIGDLTPAQREEIKVRQEMARVAGLLTPKQKAVIDGHLAELSALEQLNAEREHAAQLMRDQGADNASAIKAADDETKALEDRIRYFGLTEAAVLRLKAAELERQMAGAEGNALEMDRLFRLLAATEDQIALQEQLSRMEADAAFWKSLDDTARDTFRSIEDGGKGIWQRIKESAKNVFFDWLYQMTAKKWILNLQASADGGGLSALTSMIGGGASSGSSGESLLGSASNLLSIGKTIYSGFTGGLASTMGTYITQMGTTFGSAAVAEFGAGMSGAAGTGLASGSAAGMGSSFASALPVIGWIIAGMNMSNSLYKQGWDFNNGSVNKLGQNLGSGINLVDQLARKLGFSNSAANIISGLAPVSKLFGRKNPEITAEGLNGSFAGDRFAADNWADVLEKGGVFRSDKWSQLKSGADADFVKSMTSAYTQMKTAATGFAEVLGVSASGLDGFSKTFNIIWDKDVSKREQQVTDLLASLGNDIATALVPNIASFSAAGETASTTLQRLAAEFATTNAIMDALGVDGAQAFGAVGLASIEARERLITLAGGIEALATQTDYFTANFLTVEQQMEPTIKAVREQMAALGYAGVTTVDQFRDAVLGLAASGALATEAGAKTYAGLLALAPAFKTVADYTQGLADAAAELAAQEAAAAAQAAADAAAKAASIAAERRTLEIQLMELTGDAAGALAAQRADELAALDPTNRALQELIYARQDEAAAAAAAAQALIDSETALMDFVDAAMSGVTRAIAAQKDSVSKAYQATLAGLTTSMDAVNASISKTSALSSALKSALSGMVMAGQESANRASAQAQIQAALAIAKVSGALPDADGLKEALSTATRFDTSEFASFLDYQREFARTAGAIAELSGLTDGQLSAEQRQLQLLQGQKDLAQKAYDAEVARLDSILAAAQLQVDAINGVNNSVLTVPAAIATLAAAIQGLQSGATPPNPGGPGMTVDQLYQSTLGRSADAGGLAFWSAAFGDSIDQNEIAEFIKAAAPELAAKENGTWHEWLRAQGVPGYAKGGAHRGGWRVVGEQGPELEYTGPSRIVSNGASSDLFAGLAAEVAELKTTMAVGLSRLIGETKRGADNIEDVNTKGIKTRSTTEVS